MKTLFSLLFVAFFSVATLAQDYYWVGGSGNWTDLSHWATSSGGTTLHTSLPTSSDNVYFDANSFTATNQVVTIDDDAYCNNMDWTGVTNFPTIIANNYYVRIYGSLTLSPDMTADFYKVEFLSTTSGNTITTNGTSLGNNAYLYFMGLGGEWTLQDNLTASLIDVSAGTFNTNNNNLTLASYFKSSGNNSRTINLGSSQITTTRFWIFGTNQTINAGTSKIFVSDFKGDNDNDGPFTYYDVEFFNYGKLQDNATFNEITVPAGLELTLTSGDVFTINNLVANGTKHNPVIIKSSVAGSEATFTKSSGTVTIDYVELTDVHATGGAAFTANNSVDNGNNTGWTINPIVSQDYYWVGDGGNWSDYANHWATTSGGSTMHTDYPGPADNVYFDANSFSMSGQTVTVDIDADFNNMDWTGVTNNPTLDAPYGKRMYAYGSVTFSSGVYKLVYNLFLKGSGTFTNADNGKVYYISLQTSGTYSLTDSLTTTGLNIFSGTFNSNNQSIDVSVEFYVQGDANGTTVNLGSSSISAKNIRFGGVTVPVFNAGTSQITLSEGIVFASSSFSGFQFNKVTLTGSATVEGSNTFDVLTLEPGASVSFEAGETTTILTDLNLNGTKAAPITLNSTVAGTQATISKASGTVDGIYLVMQDIAATGGATFNASQTIDNGNNTGWNITGITGLDYYWVGGSGNWSDFANHWATTSGGTTMHTTAPGVLDNVIFDANSFTADYQQVTIDGSSVSLNDLDASATTRPFTIYGLNKEMNIYGSVNLPATTFYKVSVTNFLTTGSATLNFSGGPGGNYDVNFNSAGTWTLQGDLVVDQLIMDNGTLNTNGFDLTADLELRFTGSNAKTLNLGSSTVVVGNLQSTTAASNITVDGGTAEVFVNGAYNIPSGPTDNITFYNMTFDKPGSTNGSLIYDDINLNKLTVTPGTLLKPVGDVTITADQFDLTGTSTDFIRMEPQTSGSTLTFSKASGVVDAYYLEMQDVIATGGATFNAYFSIDNGGVIGWIFHRQSQTITFDSIPDKTYGDPPFVLTATASSGLPVSFSIVSGPATLSGDTLTITGTGTVSVKAEQPGDIDYDPAPSVIRDFEVLKKAQSIDFPALTDKTYGDAPFVISATATSGLPVSFTVVSGPATLSGDTLTITGAGMVSVNADQPGNENYAAAPTVNQVFEVFKKAQTIDFPALADKTYGDAPFVISATATSGLPVSFTVVSGPVSIAGDTVTITGAGSAEIRAEQGGNSNYEAAVAVSQTFSIAKADQSITFEPLPDITLGETTEVALVATSTSGLEVVFTATGPVTLSGNTLTPTGAGVVTVTASQPGNDNYNAATPVEQSFTINDVVSGLEELTRAGVRVYPLPASERLHIEVPADSYDQLTVYSTAGQVILWQNITDKSTAADVSGWPAGIYLLRLTGSRNSVLIKILKQR